MGAPSWKEASSRARMEGAVTICGIDCGGTHFTEAGALDLLISDYLPLYGPTATLAWWQLVAYAQHALDTKVALVVDFDAMAKRLGVSPVVLSRATNRWPHALGEPIEGPTLIVRTSLAPLTDKGSTRLARIKAMPLFVLPGDEAAA